MDSRAAKNPLEHRLATPLRIAALCVVLAARFTAAQAGNPFVLVLIDGKTEKAMGPFPYDRSVLAAAVERSATLHARGVVLKFFLNLPRSDKGDRALAVAMKKTKVLLQAGGVDDATPNPLPERFKLGPVPFGGVRVIVAGRGGVPLPQLADEAYSIGYVDVQRREGDFVDRVPMLESDGSRFVPALIANCLELAFSQRVSYKPGESVSFGNKSIHLTPESEALVQFPDKDEIAYVSLADFLQPGLRPEVQDRIVIVGLDVASMPSLPTRAGPRTAHRLFYYSLLSLYQSAMLSGSGARARTGRP
jgi:CHASE2 domain-containing sensor protein